VDIVFIVVPLLAILAILLWLMNRSMDQDRLRGHIETRGGKLLEAKLLSSGKNWWQQTVQRNYEVRYLDTDGHEHLATCITGLFKGIVWSDDKFLRYADQVQGTPMPGHTELRNDGKEKRIN
jgi:hypothetical protein